MIICLYPIICVYLAKYSNILEIFSSKLYVSACNVTVIFEAI